jgi:hypothetical protein
MAAMIQELDVRKKMVEVSEKKISISDFARWIMANSWNMHRDSAEDVIDLVSDIHLLLDERDDFSLDDAAFLREIVTLNNAHEVTVINVEYIEAWPLNKPRSFTSTTPVLVAAAHL